MSVNEMLLSGTTDVLQGGTALPTRTEKQLTEIVRARRSTPAFSASPVHGEDLTKFSRLDSKHRAVTTCSHGVLSWFGIPNSGGGCG